MLYAHNAEEDSDTDRETEALTLLGDTSSWTKFFALDVNSFVRVVACGKFYHTE
jgi:hypothetical protein